MEIVSRNFIKLLAFGSFNTTCKLERMSTYKWKQLLNVAEEQDVCHIAITGILQYHREHTHFFPQSIIDIVDLHKKDEAANSKCLQNMKCSIEKANMMNNIFLRKKLRRIIYNEIHSIDTSTYTLILLFKIIDAINAILYNNVNLKYIIDLGLYLRNKGDSIDYVKCESWINLLHMRHATIAMCDILTTYFGFTNNEFPFLSAYQYKKDTKINRWIDKRFYLLDKKNKVAKYKDIVSRQHDWKNLTPLKNLNLYPLEASSKLISNVVISLANIEE